MTFIKNDSSQNNKEQKKTKKIVLHAIKKGYKLKQMALHSSLKPLAGVLIQAPQ
jgi:hypothetical protein